MLWHRTWRVLDLTWYRSYPHKCELQIHAFHLEGKKINSRSVGLLKFVDEIYSVVVHLFYFLSEHSFSGLG